VNLKTAARRLGVHYQTAYRWVRSGELVAVKVGSGYEISDAALARFQAQRAALERVPDVEPAGGTTAREQGGGLQLLDEMVEAVLTDPRAVEHHAARTISTMLGDTAVVRVVGAEGAHRVAFDHTDPRRAVLLGALVHDGWQHELFADRARDEGSAVMVPQVAQRDVRPTVRREFHQFLGDFGLFSAIVAPVMVGGEARGTVFAARDEPGRPYAPDARDFVAAVAARVACAHDRAERARHAWALRERLVRELANAPATALSEWLDTAVEDEEPVAIADPETHILGATKGFARLVGSTVAELGAIPELIDDEEGVRTVCERLLDGEIDFFSVASGVGRDPASRVMLHGGVVRLPDATPRCIVVVAHPLPGIGRS